MQECQPSQVLFDYLQQELPLDRLARIEAHLPHCGTCREELHRLRQQIRQVQATLAQLDPAPGWPAKPQPDLIRLPARPVFFIPLPRLAVAFTAAVMLILGGVMQLSGKQSALAHSIEQLKVIVTVSMSLNRAAFMDCTVLKPGAGGENSSHHVLWRAPGDARMDMVSADGAQTIWISNETISFADSDGGAVRSMPIKTMTPSSVWQPALEFMTPTLLAKHMEGHYGLMQIGERSGAGSDEFLIAGRKDRQVVEITVDARTYLPKVLKKYALDSGRTNGERDCLLEVRFLWNQPISHELFVPGPLGGKR
jgi:hypothetical protein